MTLTDKSTVVCQAIYTLIADNKYALGLSDVLFGRQMMIPKSPAAVITPTRKQRQLVGVQGPGGRSEIAISAYIDVHNAKVGDESTERLLVMTVAEAVEDLLHDNTTLGGIIIHGFVVVVDPTNEATFENGEFRTVRMTYVGLSRTMIGA